MKLGTVVFDDKIYNLDYMSLKQVSNLNKKIEEAQKKNYQEGERIIKRSKKEDK